MRKSGQLLAPFLSLTLCLLAFMAAVPLLSPTFSEIAAAEPDSRDLPILQKWSGDYPVGELNRLPDGQRSTQVGFIDDRATFAAVWEAFQGNEKAPEVEFSENLVIFSRNVTFYNHTSIVRVILKDGVVEVRAIETMSARPIEDKVAMALAVISRNGVKFIHTGKERISVAAGLVPHSATSPLNASYWIEGKEVRLVNGRAEMETVPGAVTKLRTYVFGKPVYGDLDGDGEEDAALILVQDSGGSGTVYYLAGVLIRKGVCQGTDAALLGDRVAPRNIGIHDGIIVVNYADRRPEESMAAFPSVAKSMYLAIKDGKLTALPSPVK